MIDHHHADAHAGHGHSQSSSALTLISLAHGINHAQAALMPLVYPLVLRELGFGYSQLGIMMGVASAVGGTLQLVAGVLGRVMRRHLLLGIGNAFVGLSFCLIGFAHSFAQFFCWTVMSRVGGAAQHPVGSSLLSHHFEHKRLGLALATHFTAGNIGTAMIPMFAAILIGLWGWRVTTILFATPAVFVGLAQCFWLREPREENRTEVEAGESLWQDSAKTIANLRWILAAVVLAAGGSGHGIVTTFLPLYLSHSLKMSGTSVGLIFTALMIGGLVGPLLGGRLVDRFQPYGVILAGYGLAALATLIFSWIGSNF